MKHDHRWLKSAIASAETAQVTMPWQRGAKTRPASMKPAAEKPAAPVAQPRGIAAR